LQLAGELFQLSFGTKGVVVVVDRPHLLRHGLSQGFRQFRLDIPDLVQLATMDHRVVEDRFHGTCEGLGAVDDDEDRPCHLESAIAKPDEEVLDDSRVLGVALCDRERVLSARDVDPHRHDTDVVAEVHAVDHERHEVELREVTGQQLAKSVLGGLDEASRDRGARRGAGMGFDAFADGLETGLVAARGELGEHLLQGKAAQHLGRGEVLIGGHRKLAGSICRTHPRAPHRDASAAQGHRALLVPVAHRNAVRVVTAFRARKGDDALFQEDAHHLQARADGEREETLTQLLGEICHRDRDRIGHDHRGRCLCLVVLLHGGGPLAVGVTWRSPEHLPDGRRQAGDRHLKFHDERDNLVGCRACFLHRGIHARIGSVLAGQDRHRCAPRWVVVPIRASSVRG
jgi:hypothetical protein